MSEQVYSLWNTIANRWARTSVPGFLSTKYQVISSNEIKPLFVSFEEGRSWLSAKYSDQFTLRHKDRPHEELYELLAEAQRREEYALKFL